MEIANEHRLTEVEAREKSNTHRIEELERRVGKLEEQNTTVAVLEVRMKAIEVKLEELCNDVKSIKAKPAKRWETIITQIISIIVAAVIGFMMAQIGLGG